MATLEAVFASNPGDLFARLCESYRLHLTGDAAGALAVLEALPALAAGETVELRVAAERLREAGLLSRSGSSTKLFGQFADLFELVPAKAPNHVRRRM